MPAYLVTGIPHQTQCLDDKNVRKDTLISLAASGLFVHTFDSKKQNARLTFPPSACASLDETQIVLWYPVDTNNFAHYFHFVF